MNVTRESVLRMFSGREFQRRGSVRLNAPAPMAVKRAWGVTRSLDEDECGPV